VQGEILRNIVSAKFLKFDLDAMSGIGEPKTPGHAAQPPHTTEKRLELGLDLVESGESTTEEIASWSAGDANGPRATEADQGGEGSRDEAERGSPELDGSPWFRIIPPIPIEN